mmetsp:Transcript_14232/g.19788  ORF Transcript_14232/g.19788 Transcript_14232/m.19788 type:complete len:81 (-) Transcript_14232:927-1169(-)
MCDVHIPEDSPSTNPTEVLKVSNKSQMISIVWEFRICWNFAQSSDTLGGYRILSDTKGNVHSPIKTKNVKFLLSRIFGLR